MQPLPTTWIEAIFTRLSGIYGSRFTNMWASVDPELVRKTWAHELGGFGDKPDAIKYAFDHLPDEFPPTALQFRRLCNAAPDNTPKLPAPNAPLPEKVRREMDALKDKPIPADRWAWARRIMQRRVDGEIVSPTVLKMAGEALENEKRGGPAA
jgi:hypothetical protein